MHPILLVVSAVLATLAASCSRVVPTPTPTPPSPPAPATRAPPAPPPVARDWREAPITPGDWRWGMEGGRSVARFAGETLVLRCDRSSGTVTLQRAGTAPGPQPMTITTTSGARTVTAAPLPGPVPSLGVALPARDPLLDAMIFSRGRFAVETPGQPPLYVPSWPEVSRVAEDCR